ncbi:hypothetical protein [Roseomonas elaeocarpi]|uniref:Transporter n=1 Tax=Roseomonas elaeocarpi TaxID=907779 RepID=A0ABV6JT92_9PROT
MQSSRFPAWRLPILVGLLLAMGQGVAPSVAWADEPDDLDMGFPTTLTDPVVEEPGSVELQTAAQYDRRHRHDTFLLTPQIQVGAARNLQLTLGVPYTVGSGQDANQGDLDLSALYRLNEETRLLPSFGLQLDATSPIGPGDRSTEVQLTGIAMRTVDPQGRKRVHLNLTWMHRFDPDMTERAERYRAVVGYSQLLAQDWALVLDALHQSEERHEHDSNILEAGLRYRVNDDVVVGLGGGRGFGHDATHARVLLSLQITLHDG